MRRVRSEAGVSLRDLENRGAWRRSTISQVETGKARPSRELVQWYDAELGSDGLLLSIYAEARSRQLLARRVARTTGQAHDTVQFIEVDPPAGLHVNRGALLQARITLGNAGPTTWTDRGLRRMGAYAGLRLIGSAPDTRVPDTAPGETADVVVELRAPDLAGSVIAYWSLVDSDGRECAPTCPPIAVLLVVG
jgi:transcriptional regulator with XRE-family HTH domain